MLDEIEMPELIDLRFGSGVVRDDEGVTLFRGIIDGDCADDRGRREVSEECAEALLGIGGA